MVDAVAGADESVLFTEEERTVIAVSTELTKTARLSDQTYARMRRFFDERQSLELVINTSVANLNNRVTDAFQADIEPDE